VTVTDPIALAIHHVLEARSRWIGPGIPRDLDLAIRDLRLAADMTTGADLAREREAAGLNKATVAKRMGISRQYFGRIEEQDSPTAEIKARYRAALRGDQ
jgi:transcriptional regulator with XRE-family HTH domain